MKFEIRNRFTGSVQFVADIDCREDEETSVKIGLAVKFAIANGASLYRANLSGANLSGANLSGANLYRANLSGASLYRANLSGANLDGASLYRANLYRANLSGANLSGASLYRASLDGANLDGANLDGASLDGADLSGATYGEGVYLSKQPILISGIYWPVYIFDKHMKIGCKLFSFDDWDSFDDETIEGMDDEAASFWDEWKVPLMAMCRSHEVK